MGDKMETKLKCMISQPMRGIPDEEILEQRRKAIQAIEEQYGYEFLSTFFTDDDKRAHVPHDVVNVPLCYLSNSLKEMSKCTAVYFCKGWENARGCRIEHACAEAYGLVILTEE